jgi:acyl-coenzyme A thioesterase PaaI-like protein
MTLANEPNTTDVQVIWDRITATLKAIPFANHLGIRLVDSSNGAEVIFHLPFAQRLIGNVTLPAIHGGIVASFMQTAALAMTFSLREDIPPKMVDFSLDFLSSAGPSDLYAQCVMHRVGKRIASLGIRCWQGSPDAPVALGRAHLFIAQSSSDSGLLTSAQ